MANDSVLARVHPDLREHVATAVLAALKQGVATQTSPIKFEGDGQQRYVRINVQPVEKHTASRLALVLFVPVVAHVTAETPGMAETPGVADAPELMQVPAGLIRQLQHEIAELQQRLHMVTDEYTTIRTLRPCS